MARMISIKLDGQISSGEDGRVHMGVGMGTIWGDCGAKVGTFVCHLVVGLHYNPSRLMAAPRLGSLFATRLWAYNPSRLMAAPRLGSSFATGLWACWSSRLMIVAPGLGSFDATWLWTWVSSGCRQGCIQMLVPLPSIGL